MSDVYILSKYVMYCLKKIHKINQNYLHFALWKIMSPKKLFLYEIKNKVWFKDELSVYKIDYKGDGILKEN